MLPLVSTSTAIPPVEAVSQELSERLRRFVSRRVGNPADVEDLCQDIWVKVLKSRGPSDPGKLLAWVFQIARNTVADHYRRRRVPEPLEESEAPIEPEDSGTGLEAALRPLMSLLSAEDRQALETVDLGGVSQKEYAARLGIAPSSARSRVQRARQRLQRELEKCCRVVLDRRGGVASWEPRDNPACCPASTSG